MIHFNYGMHPSPAGSWQRIQPSAGGWRVGQASTNSAAWSSWHGGRWHATQSPTGAVVALSCRQHQAGMTSAECHVLTVSDVVRRVCTERGCERRTRSPTWASCCWTGGFDLETWPVFGCCPRPTNICGLSRLQTLHIRIRLVSRGFQNVRDYNYFAACKIIVMFLSTIIHVFVGCTNVEYSYKPTV